MDAFFGRYLPLRAFRGGMGVVYLATDLQDGRPVAVKTFRPELLASAAAREQFVAEARTWLELGAHPHVVPVHMVRHDDSGAVYVIADYIAPLDGHRDPSLRGFVGRVAPATALAFALGIARGMLHAIARVPGLVHRDLKPENVLVGRDLQARVADFGLARVRGGDGGVAGTPRYMAPEQWQGHADERTDLYAFGLILLELLAGEVALPADAAGHAAGAAARCAVHASLPPALHDLVLGCVQVAPHARPAGWRDVERALIDAWPEVAGGVAPAPVEAAAASRGARVLAGWSQTALANALGELGRPRDAAAGLRAVLAIARAEAAPDLEAAALTNLGVILAQLGELDEAAACLDASLALKRAAGNARGVASSLAARGRLLSRRGARVEALADMRAAAEQFAGLGLERDALNARFNQVNELAALGHADEALALTEACGRAFAALGDRRGEASALGTLGQLLRRAGRLDEALAASERAVAGFEACADRAGVASELSIQGHTLRAMKRNSHAIDRFERSLKLAEAIGDRLLCGSNLYALAQLTPPLPQFLAGGRATALQAAEAYAAAGRPDLAADARALANKIAPG